MLSVFFISRVYVTWFVVFYLFCRAVFNSVGERIKLIHDVDEDNNIVTSSPVTYKLFMNTGYEHLQNDNRVVVYAVKKIKDVPKPNNAEDLESLPSNIATIASESSGTVTTAMTGNSADLILSANFFLESTCFESPAVTAHKYAQANVQWYSGDILNCQ